MTIFEHVVETNVLPLATPGLSRRCRIGLNSAWYLTDDDLSVRLPSPLPVECLAAVAKRRRLD